MQLSPPLCRVALTVLTLVLAAGFHATLYGEKKAAKQFLWQTNSYGDDVHVIAIPSHQVVRQIKVGPQPHGIAAPNDSATVFIAIENFGGPAGELVWVDPRNFQINHRMNVGPKPNQIACTPDGKWVYVPCNDGHYWVIDAVAKQVAAKIETGGRPHNTQCSRDGRYMYLSPMGPPKKVTIVDVESGHKVVGEIPFSDAVRPPALSADNTRFFQNIDNLLGFEVADIASRKVIATVHHEIPESMKNLRSRCHGLAIRPDQKEIWSCNVEHKLVHIHDLTRPGFPAIHALPMIGRVYWLCFSPDSRYAYIAVRSENKTCVVDTATKKILTHLEVGNTPKRNLVIQLSED